jgi:glycosyltransferase involved in cell wall biosynthesis
MVAPLWIFVPRSHYAAKDTMRILHVVPTYIPAYRYGGPIRSVHGLCKGLVKLGHDVHVFTTNVDGPRNSNVPLDSPIKLDGVNVWYFQSRYLRRIYWSPPMADALSERIYDFDLLHLHSIYLWPTWAAARAARRRNIPYLLSPRGMLEKDLIRRKSPLAKTVWISLIEKRNIENAVALHVTSKRETAEALKFGLKLPPVFEVPNGIDLETSPSDNNISSLIRHILQKSPFLLFLGRINWKKGLDRLIPAMRHIPGMYLVIAGNDEENYTPSLEALADNYEVRGRIFFAGPVHGADKKALLKNASVLVLPSYSENFGNVVLEAMAQGCPVAVTPEVGAAEIVLDANAGIVVDGSPDIFGPHIRQLIENQELCRIMGKNGLNAVSKAFTWEKIARQMEDVYKRILAPKLKTNI